MTIETRKIRLAQSILGNLTEETINRLEEILRDDEIIKAELTRSALKSEQDIKDGNCYTMDEAKTRVGKSLSL